MKQLTLIGPLVSKFSAVVLPAPSAPAPPIFVPGGGCSEHKSTEDWDVCVSDLYPASFEIKVTALTDYATESSFKVRVYCPGFDSGDSSTKYPSYAGQTYRFAFPSDFFVFDDCGAGEYEVELRVDFTVEIRVYHTIY